MSPAARKVGISIDVDSVAAHLRGYGVEDPQDPHIAYRVGIPRALKLFESMGVRATFFLIAEEASSNRDRVQEIVAAGHEVACHSMTHRLPFDLSQPGFVQGEIRASRDLLEAVAAAPIQGFRAPSWGATDRLLQALHAAGYRYDASSFPSWTLYFLRLAVARKRQGRPSRPLRAPVRQMFLKRPWPHVPRAIGREVVEIPVSTIPLIRLPVYHTLAFVAPPPVFRALLKAVRLRRGHLNYAFHAVDFLDLRIDGVDPRLGCHPGMALPLPTKLNRAQEALTALRRMGKLSTLAEIAETYTNGEISPA
jgi:hypothetical protein